MRKRAALLLLLVALVAHPLTHVADDALCPCVNVATIEVASQLGDALQPSPDPASASPRPILTFVMVGEVPARAPPAVA